MPTSSPQSTIIKEHIKLLDILHKTTHLVVCRFEKPANLSFFPGQFAVLSTQQVVAPSEIPLKRAFSFACSPDKPYLEFCIAKNNVEGLAAYFVEKAKIGEQFLLEAPYGRFFFEQTNADTVFVAGGTGIAPLRSMIQSINSDEHTYWLFFSCRTKEELLFREEFEQLPIKFIPVLTRESEQNMIDQKTIQHALQSTFKQVQGKTMYLCGPPAFVRDVQETARVLGFTDIHKEQW